MKKVLLATVFTVALSSQVLAGSGTVQTNPGTNNGFQIQNTGTIKNTGTITNKVNTGTMNSNNKTVNTKINSDNKTTVTKNRYSRSQENSAEGGNGSASVTIQGNKRTFNAPDLGGLPSGPCTGQSGGFTLGTGVFGAGIQGGGLDDQCTLRENIRIVNGVDPELAREMLEDLEGVRAARERIAARQGGVVVSRTSSTPVQVSGQNYGGIAWTK